MTRQEKGYLLIQVTRWTGLTLRVYFVYFIQDISNISGKKMKCKKFSLRQPRGIIHNSTMHGFPSCIIKHIYFTMTVIVIYLDRFRFNATFNNVRVSRYIMGPSWSHGITTSVPIITYVVSSNPVHGEVYSIQHYVIKFVSDL
jgi:hypothetical protein